MSTERHGRIFDELNEQIGEWKAPNADQDIDEESTEELSPWEGLAEGGYTIEPFKEKAVGGLDEESSLTDDEREILGGAVRKNGTDAVAYYKSFRFRGKNPFPGKWGIFYLEKGIEFVGEVLSYYTSSHSHFDDLARKFLKAHEMFHYKVDALALNIEPPMRKHLYLPFRNAYRNRMSHCVEEALANSKAWKWANEQELLYHGILEFAEDFMDVQPNAYARYQEAPLDLAGEMAEKLVNQNFLVNGKAPDLAMWIFDTTTAINYRVPEYKVGNVDISRFYPKVLIIPKVEQITENWTSAPGRKLETAWTQTKEKLLKSPGLRGLNFKPFPKAGGGVWSVKVNRSDRAHLRQTDTTKVFGKSSTLDHTIKWGTSSSFVIIEL